MTKSEAAIVSAYTGILLGEFTQLHEYIEKILNRPVWTHELASKEVMAQIKQASKADFISLIVS